MARKLIANVAVEGVMYGPAYPDAGDPPAGTVGDHAYEGSDEPEQQVRKAPVVRK